MARKNPARLEFDALSIEGGLFPAEWLAKVAATEASAQAPADYGIPKGLALRDEIGRYWRIAQALWRDFDLARGTTAGAEGALASRAFLKQFLQDVLGFSGLTDGRVHEIDERRFPLGFEASGGRVPIIVGAPSEGIDDSVARHGDGNRRRSAFGAVQEYLNAAETALWGLAGNGSTLRLVRDNASLTRPAWVEADLARIFTEERYADFAAFWLLAHASRFGRAGTPVTECALEQWRGECQQQGSRAREALRDGVEAAILSLGQGFLAHAANRPLRQSLAEGTLTRDAYFNELLRCVYRMIFLLTIEERELLLRPDASDDAKRLYAEGYGMRRLRERAVRRSQHDRNADLWASLRPVFTALGQPEGEPTLGLPGLGGLFGSDQCPHLEDAALDNRALLGAVYRLAWIREQESGTLARVNWKDMGPEELGSVYESLLELVPVVSDDGRRFSFAGAGETAGNARKLSGSYYTPDALVQQLLDTTLEPVVARRLSEQASGGEKEKSLLDITVVDPACGSGHFLLAAARRLAGHLARLRSGGTPGAAEYRHALRDVVTHCIYGVDRNPMALELARMALWLETYTPDRALGFIDHHLVCGDALVGLLSLEALKNGIPDDAYKALTGDDKGVSKLLTKLNRAGLKNLASRAKRGQLALSFGTQHFADAFAQLDSLKDDAIEGVVHKSQRWQALRSELLAGPLALAADLFVGAFLMPKTLQEGERSLTEHLAVGRFPLTSTLEMVLEGSLTLTHTSAQAARTACSNARVLHWPLAFPQVFARGGFDVVLGNPPWEMMQTDAQEFFAVRDPEIAQAPNLAARMDLIEGRLLRERPELYAAFREEEARIERTQAFVHSVDRFRRSAIGRINLAPLFAETGDNLRRSDGRFGMVLPSGIATDSFTQELFRHFADGRIASMYDFENRAAIFPGVHRSYRFSLLTLANSPTADFAFFLSQVADLADRRRHFSLTPEEFGLINPNTRTCPTFRTNHDASLAKGIYRRVPPLIRDLAGGDADNPWRTNFLLMFMMNTDSHLFRTRNGPSLVPLYEAKMIHQFDHRWATYASPGSASPARESRDTTMAEKASPDSVAHPRYWVPREEVERRLQARQWHREWLLGWRDITNSTNERTTIATVIPRVGVGNNLPLMLFEHGEDTRRCAALLANLNSIVFDFVARQKVGGMHLNFFVYKQLPVLPPETYTEAALRFIVPRVLELTYTACDLSPWAKDLGYAGPPFIWDTLRRGNHRAELDAWYAHAYGLTRDELRYVLDPEDVMGPDWPSETFRVLKSNEERQYGEYRTRRLVLEAWDRLFGR